LAALHFNENGNRRAILEEDQTSKKRLVFKKSKGDFTLQEVKTDPTFGV
jgi:hypothetical protein